MALEWEKVPVIKLHFDVSLTSILDLYYNMFKMSNII